MLMAEERIGKDRMLEMYALLAEGKLLHKHEAAARYKCSLRSIQRDIEDLRAFVHNQNDTSGIVQDIIYDRKENGYRLVPPMRNVLRNEEVFAVLKILLESRSLTKEELEPIIEKLIDCCLPKECKGFVSDLIANEKFHYVPPRHGKAVLDSIWQLGEAVKEHRLIDITYRKPADGKVVQRLLKPVGIMFSEFYFYLAAFIVEADGKPVEHEIELAPTPTIYRIDRIESLELTEQHFTVPYAKRFEEGEFRKRVQFMYGGKLRRVKFYYKGAFIEPVLDRLPTAEVLEQGENGFLVVAEVFGDGIEMWLNSQGKLVEVVSITG